MADQTSTARPVLSVTRTACSQATPPGRADSATSMAGEELMTDKARRRGPGEMLAMVLTNDRKTRLERRPVPAPREDQVLVDIDLCGICGSDLHAPDLREVYPGGFIMGHEPAGRIAGVGRDVSGWRVGQRGGHQPERGRVRCLRGVPLRAPEPLHPRHDGTGCRPAG